MTAASQWIYSLEEYASLEARSETKHEYLDGVIRAMGGGTPEHAALASAIIAVFSNAVRGKPCRVYSSDARVRVGATGLDTYPDVTVVCAREERDAHDPLALTNPMVIVEVTSPSSEKYDRGDKLAHYKQMPSLREVVIVSHTEPRIDVHRRLADGTLSASTTVSRGRAEVASLGCAIDVDELYRDPFTS